MVRYRDIGARMGRLLKVVILLAASLSLSSTQSRASDWPQILGPDRDGAVHEETLFAENIPWRGGVSGAGGAASPLWSARVGAGYSGPIAADGVVYLLHRRQDENLLQAFDLQKGGLLWGVSFPATYRGGIDPDEGPRAMPVAVPDPADPKRKLIVCFTAEADMHVVRTPLPSGAQGTAGSKRGEIVWSRKLGSEYRIFDSYFGAGSSPIVVGDRILVNLGGRDGAGIVALDLVTGKTLWTATDEQASYSSPIAAKVGERDAVVFVTRLSLLGIDPAKGEVLFTTRFGQTGPTVNAATPIAVGKRFFVTASYNLGCRLVDVSGAEPQDVWSSERTLSSQYATPILHDGYLYGCDGREDQGAIDLVCLRVEDGKEMWREAGEGMTHLIRVGDSALGLNVDGTLTQFPLHPTRYAPVAKARLAKPNCRALPALSDGIFLARQTDDSGGSLIAVRVGPAAESGR